MADHNQNARTIQIHVPENMERHYTFMACLSNPALREVTEMVKAENDKLESTMTALIDQVEDLIEKVAESEDGKKYFASYERILHTWFLEGRLRAEANDDCFKSIKDHLDRECKAFNPVKAPAKALSGDFRVLALMWADFLEWQESKQGGEDTKRETKFGASSFFRSVSGFSNSSTESYEPRSTKDLARLLVVRKAIKQFARNDDLRNDIKDLKKLSIGGIKYLQRLVKHINHSYFRDGGKNNGRLKAYISAVDRFQVRVKVFHRIER